MILSLASLMDGDGKRAPPPSLPLLPPSYLFTPSLHLHPNPSPQTQVYPHLDWDSLISCPNGVTSTNSVLETASLASTCQSNTANKDDRERRTGSSGRKASTRHHRFAFQTRSADDILDDGYRWRKYGQKSVNNSIYARSYYRCTQHTCNVKKQVQRLSEDTCIVETTYEGIHNHPSENLMQTLSPLLKQIEFLSSFSAI